ncbi:hypothetical protein ACFVXC_13350, partial [Streptomyces sp. NPDC058257]
MSAVEQFARAHVVTDSPDDQLAVPAVLRYDPEAGPPPGGGGRARGPPIPGPPAWAGAREGRVKGA